MKTRSAAKEFPVVCVGGSAGGLDTAAQPDMPESAIASGCIDFILSLEDIAKKIIRIPHGESKAEQENSATGSIRPKRWAPALPTLVLATAS